MLVITGGLVHSVTSPHGEPRDIVVDGDTIVDIVPPGAVRNANAQVIDASRRLIIPGLIDLHWHAGVRASPPWVTIAPSPEACIPRAIGRQRRVRPDQEHLLFSGDLPVEPCGAELFSIAHLTRAATDWVDYKV